MCTINSMHLEKQVSKKQFMRELLLGKARTMTLPMRLFEKKEEADGLAPSVCKGRIGVATKRYGGAT